MLERQLEARFARGVKAAGGMTFKIPPVVAGVPDRGVILGGKVHLVELKTERGQLSAIQMHWHARAAALGVIVVVLRGADEIDAWIERNR